MSFLSLLRAGKKLLLIFHCAMVSRFYKKSIFFLLPFCLINDTRERCRNFLHLFRLRWLMINVKNLLHGRGASRLSNHIWLLGSSSQSTPLGLCSKWITKSNLFLADFTKRVIFLVSLTDAENVRHICRWNAGSVSGE